MVLGKGVAVAIAGALEIVGLDMGHAIAGVADLGGEAGRGRRWWRGRIGIAGAATGAQQRGQGQQAAGAGDGGQALPARGSRRFCLSCHRVSP